MTDNTMPMSIISHVSVGVADVERAAQFYDAVLAPLGIRRQMSESFGIAYGTHFPEFWISLPYDGQSASAGNGTHVAFIAPSRESVVAFHTAGLANGGMDNGPPGLREYTPDYFAAYLIDLDGNKIEAVHMNLG